MFILMQNIPVLISLPLIPMVMRKYILKGSAKSGMSIHYALESIYKCKVHQCHYKENFGGKCLIRHAFSLCTTKYISVQNIWMPITLSFITMATRKFILLCLWCALQIAKRGLGRGICHSDYTYSFSLQLWMNISDTYWLFI